MAESPRRTVERWLETTVRAHRTTISVTVPAIGALLLVASAEGWLPPSLAFQPTLVLLGTAVMRLPLIAGVLPLVDRRGAVAIVGLIGYAYLIEFVGVTTGWPYGDFAYRIALGPMVGGVPAGLPIFFVPLVVNAYLLSVLLLGPRAERRALRLPATLGLVLAIDVVLDPGAVALGFWTYGGGLLYGVPLSNYAGWLLSGTVATVVMDVAFSRASLRDRLESAEFALDDVVSFVLLWGGVNAVYANWLAAAVALVLFAALLSTDRFDVVLADRVDVGHTWRWLRRGS
ncbi:MAG: bisanhydrobacterioruberin hydratase [Halanaeroarchaeum sp.]